MDDLNSIEIKENHDGTKVLVMDVLVFNGFNSGRPGMEDMTGNVIIHFDMETVKKMAKVISKK